MIPPKIGPITPDIDTIIPAIAPIHFFILLGKISGKITIANEYKPEPPIPCRARKTMSWLIVCANPHPIENAKKITYATRYAFRLPTTSPMLGKSTAQPTSDKVYASAIQLIFEREPNSVPIVTRAVAVMELSRKDMNSPRQRLDY